MVTSRLAGARCPGRLALRSWFWLVRDRVSLTPGGDGPVPAPLPQPDVSAGLPGSAREAVAMALAGLGWLASADLAGVPVSVQADCLRGLERALAAHTAARAKVLAAFTAAGGYEH